MTPRRQKGVLLILDGLGDLPHARLSGQTPLEAADTPVLNRLATAGRYGLVDPITPGKVPNTHSGCSLLLGLLPSQLKRLKRGPVEAAGAGRPLRPGEIAVRANFASMEAQNGALYVTDRRAGRISEGTDLLASVLQDVDLGDGVSATLISTDQHRGALIMKGDSISDAVGDTDPGDIPLPAQLLPCQAKSAGGEFTAAKIDRFIAIAHSRLKSHPVNAARLLQGLLPANGIITRGAGSWFNIDNVFEQKGIKVSVVAGCNTVTGLGKMFGFDVVTDSRFTATVDTDLDAKMEAAVLALECHDMVYIHVKAPDICAHDFQPETKRDVLARLDRSMQVLEDAGCVIALAADHSTDSNTGFHTADPVPAVIYDPLFDSGSEPVNFGESACREGNMARQTGSQFLQEVVQAMRW